MSGYAYCGKCPARWNNPHAHCHFCHDLFATDGTMRRHWTRRGCTDPGTLGMAKLAHRNHPYLRVWTFNRANSNGYIDAKEATIARAA